MNKRMDRLEEQLNEHIEDTNRATIKKMRQYLVEFVTEGVNGKRHTKESFETAIRACDQYQAFVKAHNIKNGVINSTIQAIRAKYEEHLIKADFAKEQYYINDENNNKK